MIPLLLSGCARREEAALLAFRESLTGQEIAFSADVTSLDRDNALTYGAEVTCRAEETAVTVTFPETIAGITFRKGAEEALEYDGAVLVLTGDDAPISPANAAPLLYKALTEGRVLYTGRGGEQSFVTLPAAENITVTVYFDRAFTCPLSAEIAGDGMPVLSMVIRQWRSLGKTGD